MDPASFFQDTFADACQLFADSARSAGLEVVTYPHPLKGLDEESLATHTALLGNEDSPNLVVLVSGTHGVETLCGSACQSAFMSGPQRHAVADDTAVLLIHGLNCWGASHLRRNNEDNVDLSRNFLEFGDPLPVNGGYEQLHEALCCPHREGPERAKANQVLDQFVRDNGVQRYVAALMGGQYQHPDGFAYGGQGAVWSHQLLNSVLEPFRASARRVFVVEYHSGLGPWGYGTAVTMQTGPDLERIKHIYGGWVEAPNTRSEADDQHYFKPQGHPSEGLRRLFPDAELNTMVLEYGTYPPMQSLPVLLDDHWLARHGNPKSELGRAIKSQLLEMHYPVDPDWRLAVSQRSVQVIDQTFRALNLDYS